MKKLTKEIPISAANIVPFPAHFNLVSLLTAACSLASLQTVLDLWRYILDTGVNPCWEASCLTALSRVLCKICYPVYSRVASLPVADPALSKIASNSGKECET